MGETSGATEPTPGLVLLPRQGVPRLLGPLLLEYLGLDALPPLSGTDGIDGLMTAAGFHQRDGARDLWEREERAVRVGEELLAEGGRLVWVLPEPWSAAEAPRPEGRVAERVRYLSLASHDLRGSLANIRSYAALLLNGRVPLEPKAQRGLETILRNADRALAFAQDFFDSSRADLGALACERERQPLLPILAAAVERMRAAASAANVALVMDPLPDLPDMEVDAGRIQHAVEAFVHHHLGHAQPGEELHVRATPQGHQVRVEVRRDGAAVPEEDTSAIFQCEERAFRERKLEDPLRVFLARQEVEAHGGQVGAQADAGGSTLFLTLPVPLTRDVGQPAGWQA
ncbi:MULTISPECIES: sensor histidine kinase KdpD [Corallococcus]|uniref:sensor histidine kinase n=1 Tax=Corallococcus TaxID=83461 RepID=UPI00117C418E|nr:MULTISPECIES: HAMP domain-containing sensor histidine kinase [Corallococcus]NBD10904.1 sensor histidine kinase [Corallococcus silvisoli]TSC31983.1 HAMP domain-containing histidine kinase [Corallococcus sp. Z5C101001]